MLRRFHPLALVLVLLGLVTALGALLLRYRVEARSRAVSMVLDYGQFRSLVTSSGTPLEQAYRDFKGVGITGIALTEETLGELESSGLLKVEVVEAPTGREYRLTIADPILRERVFDHITHLAPAATEDSPTGELVVLEGPGGGRAYVPGRFDDLRSLPAGLEAREVAEVRKAGLEPVGRVLNPLSLTSESLAWKLGRIKSLGITLVIFGGEEVLGFRGLINETAEQFRKLGLIYGSVEFGKQRGDEALSRALLDRLVRVHSVSSAEMAKLPENEAVERYVRAPVERNIRLNYVRLPGVVTASTYRDSVQYIRKLSRLTASEGFGLAKVPRPLDYVWGSPIAARGARALMALGVGAAAVLLLAGLVPLSRLLQAALALVVGLVCAVMAFSGVNIALQLVALLAAVVFPTLAFVLFLQPVGAFDDHAHALVRQRKQAILPAVVEFLALSGITLMGALIVAGLLSELPFMIKVQSFAGIKVATVIPLLLVAGMYLTGTTGQYPSRGAEWEAVTARVRRFLDEPVRIWHTVAVLVGLMALALLVMRSGNDPGVGVSEMEIRFRAILDRVLGVRPRTKEFLLGHPALLLGLALAMAPRWRMWALPLILVGVIGQVGMLNSFCHLHSPLKLTLLRTFHGIWIGGLIGVGLIWIWSRFQGNKRQAGEPLPG